jgi:hypothetical protein
MLNSATMADVSVAPTEMTKIMAAMISEKWHDWKYEIFTSYMYVKKIMPLYTFHFTTS